MRRTSAIRAIVQEQTPQQAGTKEAENQLEALKAISLVVADTGEIDSIRKYGRYSFSGLLPFCSVDRLTSGPHLQV